MKRLFISGGSNVWIVLTYCVVLAVLSAGAVTFHARPVLAKDKTTSDSQLKKDSARKEGEQVTPVLIDGPAEWHKRAEFVRAGWKKDEPYEKLYVRTGLTRDLSYKLFEYKQFAAVDEGLAGALSKISDPWEAHAYSLTIASLTFLRYAYEPDDIRDLLRRWTTEQPSSHFAWLIRGRQAVNYAWYWRGEGYVNTVPKEAWERFHAAMKEARDFLRRSSELRPDDPESAYGMMEVCLADGCPEAEFRGYFDRVCKLVPSHLGAHNTMRTHLSPWWGGSWEQVDAFEKVVDKKIEELENPLLRLEKYHAYLDMAGRREGYQDLLKKPEVIEEVIGMYKAIAERWPDKPEGHADYAWMLMRNKRLKEATEQFDFVGNRIPSDIIYGLADYHEDRLRASIVYGNSVRVDEQKKAFQHAIEIDPKNPNVYIAIANGYRLSREFVAAADTYVKAIEVDPSGEFAREQLVSVYEQMGRLDDALHTIAEARRTQLSDKTKHELDGMEERIRGKTTAQKN